MTAIAPDDLAWSVRAFVYAFLAAHELPPTAEQTASQFAISLEQARAAYHWLNDHHALFLEPGTTSIRMAHPFSGIATPFIAHANGHRYYANCAWDLLGVPAALHADARLEATCADTLTTATIHIANGQVVGQGEVIHMLTPFRRWYDDLVFT